MLQKINRGDVYFYNFGFDYDGSVEGKNRPCVIISNDKGNTFGTTALVAPITTRSKASCKPWQVHFYNGDKSQVILCEQIKTVNISKLYNYQGRLDVLTMKAVDEALAIEFDLNVTQREQDSTEFLHRLDDVLERVITRRITTFENKISDIVSKAIVEASDAKNSYEELCNQVIEKVTNVVSNNTDVINGINEIKLVFNKSADNLDKILNSLINLYKTIDTSIIDKSLDINVHKIVEEATVKSLEKKVETDITEFTQNVKTIAKTDVTKRVRYTLEEAKSMVEDYYNMNRTEFMSKYNLKDQIMCNNRLTTMKNILKKNGIDYRNIKNHVTVRNIRDLPEEEKRKYKKYLKDTESQLENTVIKTDRRNTKWQPKINYENVPELLDFIKECNENSVSYICDKYGLTKKQLSDRKYLIGKSLKDRNIPFTMIKKSRKGI